MSVEQFRNGMRVRVTDHGGRSDMNGLTGKVVRIKSRADSAWIQSDTPLSDKQRRFPSSDERANHFDVYDNECEEIRAEPAAPTEGATMKDSHGQTVQDKCKRCGNKGQVIQLINGPAICTECDKERREEEKYV